MGIIVRVTVNGFFVCLFNVSARSQSPFITASPWENSLTCPVHFKLRTTDGGQVGTSATILCSVFSVCSQGLMWSLACRVGASNKPLQRISGSHPHRPWVFPSLTDRNDKSRRAARSQSPWSQNPAVQYKVTLVKKPPWMDSRCSFSPVENLWQPSCFWSINFKLLQPETKQLTSCVSPCNKSGRTQKSQERVLLYLLL